MTNPDQEKSLYERFGGEKTLKKLVPAFYAKVAKDPDLAPIFPDDLTETTKTQYMFLTQFFGGPALYVEHFQRHPMLRARHMPFEITPTRAKVWLNCMLEAMNELEIEEEIKNEMFTRLAYTAQHMVNTPDEE
jgi:hemoglobin